MVSGSWRVHSTSHGLTSLGQVGGNRSVLYLFHLFNIEDVYILGTHCLQEIYGMHIKTISIAQVVKFAGKKIMFVALDIIIVNHFINLESLS